MKELAALIVLVAIGIAVMFGAWYGWKSVQVWGASMNGQAILAEAEFSKQVRIQEAQAKLESAEREGQAELKRAEYAARANQTMVQGLGGPEGYLRYLYIRMLEEQGGKNQQIIYIPTEAGMPILEAGKR